MGAIIGVALIPHFNPRAPVGRDLPVDTAPTTNSIHFNPRAPVGRDT